MQSRKRPLRLGLTGGIGSGKSTVGSMLQALGAGMVDADQIARELTAPQGAAIEAIRAAFGSQFIDAGGALDRARMREHALVFFARDAAGVCIARRGRKPRHHDAVACVDEAVRVDVCTNEPLGFLHVARQQPLIQPVRRIQHRRVAEQHLDEAKRWQEARHDHQTGGERGRQQQRDRPP